MRVHRHLLRNVDAVDFLEIFFVSGVSSILAVRLFLHLTGYPQVGNDTWHIAHVLWGGLMMALALMILLIFLDRNAQYLSALAGGIGFGLFIDEVGKFVTRDNDYFFQPSVSIMYVVFMLLFLASRFVLTESGFSATEYLANSLNEMKTMATGKLSGDDRRRILYHLQSSDRGNPLTGELEQVITTAGALPPARPGVYRRWKDGLSSAYRGVASARWFPPAITIVMVLELLSSVLYVLGFFWSRGMLDEVESLSFSDWAIFTSNALSALLILWGVLWLRRSRLKAFRMFERSFLVDILFGQVFLFYRDEFGALTGLAVNLVLLVMIRFFIRRESSEQISRSLERAAAIS